MAKIKRLFNDPYDIVEEMVEGYVGAHKQYVKMCDLDEAQGRVVLANDAGTKDKDPFFRDRSVRRRIKAYSTFASLDRGVNVGASKRKFGSRVKLTAFSG